MSANELAAQWADEVARQWDGCMHDAGPSGEIDIGAAIREAFDKRLALSALAHPAQATGTPAGQADALKLLEGEASEACMYHGYTMVVTLDSVRAALANPQPAPAELAPHIEQLAAALGWRGGISDPITSWTTLLRAVAELARAAAPQSSQPADSGQAAAWRHPRRSIAEMQEIVELEDKAGGVLAAGALASTPQAAQPAAASEWHHLKAYGYAPGDYMNRCITCDQVVGGLDKLAARCRPCAERLHDEAPTEDGGDQPVDQFIPWPLATLMPFGGKDVVVFRPEQVRDAIRAALAATPPSPPAAPVEQIDAQRTRFEEFFSWSRNQRGAQHREKQLLRNDDGTYCDDHTQRHWWTWQQAVRASAAPQGGQEAAERTVACRSVDKPTNLQCRSVDKSADLQCEAHTQHATAPQPSAVKVPKPRRARKVGGSYQADGSIVSEFRTLAGEQRFVFEFDSPAGMLHIFGPQQLEIAAPSAQGEAS